jgi:hypothetical protein
MLRRTPTGSGTDRMHDVADAEEQEAYPVEDVLVL